MGFVKWVFAGASLALAGAAGATPADDAIREVETAQAATWNAHDAHGFAQLFAPDADVIDVRGSQWHGRDATELMIARAFASVFAKSSLRIDAVNVRSLSPDLALAYVNWTMTGIGSGGDVARSGIQTQVLKKIDDRWLILSFQNTSAMPDRPLPTAAVQPAAKPEAEKPKRRCIVGNARGGCVIGG
jgi:uncharacterized protein (TIGR02246 family)